MVYYSKLQTPIFSLYSSWTKFQFQPGEQQASLHALEALAEDVAEGVRPLADICLLPILQPKQLGDLVTDHGLI